MEATVTASMPPVPLDPLQGFFMAAGMSVAVATRFMEAHQLVNIHDILFFSPIESQDFMKIYNG